MNLYGPDFFTDDELIAEIKQYAKARKDYTLGGQIGVIAGEGRRVEYHAGSSSGLDADLREMLYEARARGLSIGGDPGNAITVEFS